MNSKSTILSILITVVVVTTIGYAQHTPTDSAYVAQFKGMSYERILNKVWEDVKDLNKIKFPNPDLVQPGDTLMMPLNEIYIVRDIRNHNGRHDCIWNAAELFMWGTIFPIQNGTFRAPLPTTPPKTDTVTVVVDRPVSLWPWVLLGFVVLVIAIVLLIRSIQRHEQECQQARKFVPDPPDFRHSSDASVESVAEEALQRIYGRNIKIVGPIERGFINGEQIMFNADGSTTTERFDNEPGYRTRIQFENGDICEVVCRWACFNPIYSCNDVEFNGTFRPEDSSIAAEIPVIEDEQIEALQESIRGSELPLAAEAIPGIVEPEQSGQTTTDAPITADAPTDSQPADPEHQMVKLGGCQLSKARLTIDTFEGTPAQLDKVLDTLSRHAQALGESKPAADTPAKD